MNKLDNTIKHYNDATFTNCELSHFLLEEVIFSNCRFMNCLFNEAKLLKCKFQECEFSHCDLSMVNISETLFSDTIFNDSKLIGINWTTTRWPQIKLTSPISFYRCNISHSSFFEMSLVEIIMESCRAQDIDFRGADLSHANLSETDFAQSLFQHTNLSYANLTDSFNYHIDPTQNEIKKAKFSFPEVIGLLKDFDIEIMGIDEV